MEIAYSIPLQDTFLFQTSSPLPHQTALRMSSSVLVAIVAKIPTLLGLDPFVLSGKINSPSFGPLFSGRAIQGGSI